MVRALFRRFESFPPDTQDSVSWYALASVNDKVSVGKTRLILPKFEDIAQLVEQPSVLYAIKEQRCAIGSIPIVFTKINEGHPGLVITLKPSVQCTSLGLS